MCARYQLILDDPSAFTAAFDVPFPEGAKRTAYPGAVMPVITADDATRCAQLAQWGLIPAWAKEATIGKRCFNARAETVAEKPAFRDSFLHSRCIVPASRFTEWGSAGTKRVPYEFASEDGEFLAMAGLLATWRAPDGVLRETYTVLTTAAFGVVAPIHERMPVLLRPDAYDAWLAPATKPPMLHALLAGASTNAEKLAIYLETA